MKNEIVLNKHEKVIIGVTGGIASGKTTVSKMLAEKGAKLIDADKISHCLTREDDAVKKNVIKRFGKDIMRNGEIDRALLRKKVLSEKKGFEDLFMLIGLPIIKKIKHEVETCSASRVVVIDAPLLIEGGLHKYVHMVVLVTASRDTRIKRAVKRGVPKKEVIGIIERQLPQDEKLKYADYIIDGEANIDTVKKGVDRIWQKVQKKKKI